MYAPALSETYSGGSLPFRSLDIGKFGRCDRMWFRSPPHFRWLALVVGLVILVWRWFRFIYSIAPWRLVLVWALWVAVVSSYHVVRLPWALGLGVPLLRRFRISYAVFRSRWVLGLTGPPQH